MKIAFTVKLPNTEKRLQSAAWQNFTRNIDRAILNMKRQQQRGKQ